MALKPVFNTKALEFIWRNTLLQMRKNAGKKLSHLIKGTDIHGQSKGKKLGLQWKLTSISLQASKASYGSQGFSCSLPSSRYHSLCKFLFWSDTFNRVGISSEICQFSRGRDLFGLRDSGRGSVWFCKHNLHTSYFYSLAFLSKGLGSKPPSKSRFKIPRLNWRLQMGGPSLFRV